MSYCHVEHDFIPILVQYMLCRLGLWRVVARSRLMMVYTTTELGTDRGSSDVTSDVCDDVRTSPDAAGKRNDVTPLPPLQMNSLSPDMVTQATPPHVTVTVHAEDDDTTSNYDNAEAMSLLDAADVTADVTEVTYVIPEATVVDSSAAESGESWERLKISSKSRRIKSSDAVAALGKKHDNRHAESPLGYKGWLLRLSRRRRLEVLIGVGLSLWLAFFVVLAIFMNGKSSKLGDDNFSHGDSNLNTPELPGRPVNVTRFTTYDTPIGADNQTSNQSSTIAIIATKHTIPITKTTKTPETSAAPQQKTTAEPAKPENTPKPKNNTLDSTTIHKTKETKESKPTEPAKATISSSKYGKPTRTTIPVQPTTQASNIASTPDMEPAREVDLSPKSVVDRIKEIISDRNSPSKYMVGVGRADITGPAADVNMMGYANPNQISGGLHMRQYSRAFLVQQGGTRVLFVNIDACMGSLLVKLEVLKVLKHRYGGMYNAGNVCISGTHTHSAPAGFLQDVLFQITSMGYVDETLQAMVEGIVESIRIAHENVAPGLIMMNKGELLDTNINRSPLAYVNNPMHEKARYKYDVDKQMTLLKFVDQHGNGIGMINWFPVHCTSMNNTNTLISGDNKGYAELLFEEAMHPGSLPGGGRFVAAFAQSNEGDVSPNTRGPHCTDTGLPCGNVESTCEGKVQNCIASGPGKDMFESTKIIGTNQFNKAMELYDSAQVFLSGPVVPVHQYIDMTNQTVRVNSTHSATTCKPAMGFSFAAGTTDGPGAFDFKQGDKSGNGFWKVVRNFLHAPSQELKDCHAPKPILLATGEMNYPYPWQPEVVDTQLFRIGQFLISAVPGEFTTMAGRRLAGAVKQVFSEAEPDVEFESVVAGLSNTYSDYIATYEEYHVQRYEGASTIYGPHTLSAYIQQYKRLAYHVTKGSSLPPSGEAHDMKSKLMSFVLPVIFDTTPFGYSIGDVIVDANDSYTQGDTVSVKFYSGNPRNSPTFNTTFLEVQQEVDGRWEVVLTDGCWDTKFIWGRSSFMGNVRGISEATIEWDISPTTPPGNYQIHHYGHYKAAFTHKIHPYHGRSRIFQVGPLS